MKLQAIIERFKQDSATQHATAGDGASMLSDVALLGMAVDHLIEAHELIHTARVDNTFLLPAFATVQKDLQALTERVDVVTAQAYTRAMGQHASECEHVDKEASA